MWNFKNFVNKLELLLSLLEKYWVLEKLRDV